MNKEVIDYSTMPVERRMELAEKIYVLYPHLQEVLSKIRDCHQKSKRSLEPKCLFISGMSGCGKTSTARYYLRDFPHVENEEGRTVPVLFSSILAPATVKSVATGLLESMRDPCADMGTTVSQTLRLIRLIKACKVELIILDEFQHLIDRDSSKILQNVANWLKTLINETKVPMVLCGMPWSEAILRNNSQLKRRFQARLDLNTFSWMSAEGQKDFRRLLKAVEDRLPFIEPSNLADYHTAFRFFCASRGVISMVMRIIIAATEIALKRNQEKITLDCLARAYEEEIGITDRRLGNPFETSEEKLYIPQEEAPETWHEVKGRRAQNKYKISEILAA